MDKKFYQEPTMKVVLLKQRAHLLVGSDGEGSGEDFQWDT